MHLSCTCIRWVHTAKTLSLGVEISQLYLEMTILGYIHLLYTEHRSTTLHEMVLSFKLHMNLNVNSCLNIFFYSNLVLILLSMSPTLVLFKDKTRVKNVKTI